MMCQDSDIRVPQDASLFDSIPVGSSVSHSSLITKLFNFLHQGRDGLGLGDPAEQLALLVEGGYLF